MRKRMAGVAATVGVSISLADGMQPRQYRGRALGAALRALADQVVPHPGRYPMNSYMEGVRDAKQDVRAAILALATELEGQ